jgi:hypothetical protein
MPVKKEESQTKAQRIQIDLSPKAVDTLKRLKEETGLSTYSAIIAQSLSFKDQIMRELAKDESNRLLIVNDKGEAIQILIT